MTVNQIAIKRETSNKAVYKIIKKLKEKGYLSGGVEKGLKKSEPLRRVSKVSKNMIRLHGQEFNIKIISKSNYYRNLIMKTNMLEIDGHTIRLYRDSIEIYAKKDFIAETAHRATAISIQYWDRFLIKLENEFKVVLKLNRHQNISQVNAHYAETNNELAEDSIEKEYKIKIYTTEDGKLWFQADDSLHLKEGETLHPETGKRDMDEVVALHLNDWRDNKPPTLSQMMILLKEQAKINKDTAAGLNATVTFLKSQIPEQIKKEKPLKKDKPEYIG